MPQELTHRTRIITTQITEQWTPYCQAPGGPGCTNATPDGPCCQQGFWRTIEATINNQTEQPCRCGRCDC